MNDGILPFLLMSASVALTLTLVPMRVGLAGVAGFAASALLVGLLSFSPCSIGLIVTGFWLSTIFAAALVLVPVNPPMWAVLAAAINAGLWFGALMSSTSFGPFAPLALSVALFFVPGRWFRSPGRQIVLKVLSSWLIAVGVLATLVSLVPTPGYEPDHME